MTSEHTEKLHSTARALVAPPRGILAADESPGTMSQRLEKVGVEPTPEARRDYREMLLTTPGLSESVSGIILADETFNQEPLGRPHRPAGLRGRGRPAGDQGRHRRQAPRLRARRDHHRGP